MADGGRWVQWVRRAVVVAMLATAASCGEAPDSGGVVPTKVTPHRVSATEPDDASAAWALFDRDTKVGWQPAASLFSGSKVGVTLGEIRSLAYLKVHGSSPWALTVRTPGGEPVQGLEAVKLDSLSEGWNVLHATEHVYAERLTLEFSPLGDEPAPISEIEIWTLEPGPKPAVDRDSLRALLEATPSDHAVIPEALDFASALPETVTLSSTGTSSQEACASVSFVLDRNPRAYRRAYIAYRAEGAFRPFVMTRALNTGAMRRGKWLKNPADSGPRLFVDPIDPESLHPGENSYDFCLPVEAKGSVQIHGARFVGEVETGDNLVEWASVAPLDATPTEAAPELLDPENTDPRIVGPSERVVVGFDRLVSPDLILVASSSNWSFDCLDADGAAQPLGAASAEADSGRVPYYVAPPNDHACAAIALHPSDPGGGELRSVTVIGSGARRRIDWPRITLASHPEHFGRIAWVDGWASAPSDLADEGSPIRIELETVDTGTELGVYGKLLERTGDPDTSWPVSVTARFSDHTSFTQQFLLDKNGEVDPDSFLPGNTNSGGLSEEEKAKRYGKPGEQKSETVDSKNGGSVWLGTHVGVEIPGGALNKDTEITLKHLDATQVPPLDPGMVNVTAPDAHAYEFLPHGQTFKKPVEITLPFDVALIPQGYLPEEIHSYFYDEEVKRWQRLTKKSFDPEKGIAKSLTDHFTVMINAVVVAPEHPQMRQFNPNEIRDIQAADPGSRVNLIEPPEANPRGDAVLSYPLELPPGRRGLEPRLALTYDSSRGNGWVGMGWDLPLRAITIDTRWGAARYHPTKESDTYLLEGEMLTPFAHRDPTIDRNKTGDKIFHTRVEGEFRKIVRHGNHPTEYWWEVTDKTGTKYFYGAVPEDDDTLDEGAILRAPNGVFLWALEEIRDTHGNSIRYTYAKVPHKGFAGGTVDGFELYPKSIDYTRFGPTTEGPYKIEFLREGSCPGESQAGRCDIIIDGRGGFKHVTAERLQRIEVRFQSKLVRAWELHYTTGAFHKSLLQKIQQFGADTAGSEVAFPGNAHTFEYFDEIRDESSPENYKGFAQAKDWDAGTDTIPGGVTVPDPLTGTVSADVTVLGATRSSGWGTHSYVGWNPTTPSKQNSGGFKVGSSRSRSEGRTAFVDIDGDGLPDKVFKTASGFEFRRNESGPALAITDPGNFAATKQDLPTLPGISADESRTRSSGGEIYPLIGFVTRNRATTFTRGTGYFSDVNGDGLPDYVNEGTVFFNAFFNQPGTVPVFSSSSGGTPFPMTQGKVASSGLLPGYSTLKTEIAEKHPLVDSVRFWIAPFFGMVDIAAPAALKDPDASPDGVRLSIQHNDVELWKQTVTGPGIVAPTGVTDLTVSPGDRLSFRVSSIDDPQGDSVVWNPKIQYQAQHDPDANGLSQSVFQASSDFVMGGRDRAVLGLPFKGQIKVKGRIGKKKTSDHVRLLVVHDGPGFPFPIVLYDQTLPPASTDAFDVDVPPFTVFKDEVIQARFSSDSPIDWTALQLHGGSNLPLTATYLSAENEQGQPLTVFDGNGDPLFARGVPFDLSIYSVHRRQPSTLAGPFGPQARYTVKPQCGGDCKLKITVGVSGLGSASHPVYFTIKRVENSGPAFLLYKHTAPIPSTELPIELAAVAGQELFFDFSTLDPALMMSLSTSVTVEYPDASIDTNPFRNLYFAAEQDECTRPYRGWGYGAFNGNKAKNLPLPVPMYAPDDEAFCIAVAEPKNKKELGDDPDDAAEYGDDLAAKTVNFALLPFPAGRTCQRPEEFACPLPADTPLWGTAEELVYVSATEQSSARHGAEEFSIPDANAAGAGANAPIRVTESAQSSTAVGVAGVSASKSTGNATAVVDYIDLNGDGFPDVVAESGAQYTSSRGELDPDGLSPGVSTARKSHNEAFSAGFGGTVPMAKVNARGRGGTTVQSNGDGAGNKQQLAQLGLTLSASENLGHTRTEHDLIDVNGDGLPDRVYHVGGFLGSTFLVVQLNVGHAFLPHEAMHADTPEPSDTAGTIHQGNSNERSFGADIGFNDKIYGFGGGLSFTRGQSQLLQFSIGSLLQQAGFDPQIPEATLADVNGDGLVDRVTYGSSGLLVAINRGAGHAKPAYWGGLIGDRDLTRSASLTRGAGAYFTVGFGLPLVGGFAIFNPGGDAFQSLQIQEAQLVDINGDGYPDHVKSDGPNDVRASLSLVGKTNMLRQVHRPLGGKITVDYRRTGNTFEHPQSRWVLDRVVTDDGVHGDWRTQRPGADYQLTTYAYGQGFYDRFEREFYGFDSVVEVEHDTRGVESASVFFHDPSTNPNPFSKPYRATTRTFDNDTFFTKGLLLQETVTGSDPEPGGVSGLFTHVENAYVLVEHHTETGATKELTDPAAIKHTPHAVFPELRSTLRQVHEGSTAESLQTQMTYEYDTFGNVTKLVDSGDASTTGDDFTAIITYTGSGGTHSGCKANHIVGLADTITVTSLTSQLLRHRRASFDCSTGDLLQLEQTIDGGQKAISNFAYFPNGNLLSAAGPQNLKQERYTLAFQYDAVTETHVTHVTDSFNYVSTAEYDLRFGEVSKETDLNGNPITREFDGFGRLVKVTGPYEQNVEPYTIQFEYHPEQLPHPHAITHHIDVFRNPSDPITTILFTDGLKRVVQTKKDATIHSAPGAAPADMMIVSGRVAFDHLGRTIEAFYPVTEPTNATKTSTNLAFNPSYDSITPTTTTYDVMNRVRKTTIPDNTTTTHQYTIATDKLGLKRLATTTIDHQQQLKRTYRDIRDLIRAIEEKNSSTLSPGTQIIWTLYEYDPLQQLVAVQDDKNNLTKVSYDLLGRRTSIDNPDTGKTTMVYDPASNLTQKITANLATQSKSIQYDYDFNRLKSITYPSFTENDVFYTYGGPELKGAPGNRVGRITRVEDESGTEDRLYGKLGEIVQETKTVASDTKGKSENAPETWTTSYVYDTWGRLQQMTYHDGEVLTYKYDSGGLPRQATGVKMGIQYPYVEVLEYDKFEQRAFLKEGNGVETKYQYDPLDRRLANLKAGAPNDPNGDFQDLSYEYDDVGNILKLDNSAKIPKAGDYGGPVTQTFQYDGLYRLTQASGEWKFAPAKQSTYNFTQSYDSIHNITKKTQTHDVHTPGNSVIEQKKTSYDLTYSYGSSHPHAPTKISGTDNVHKGGRTFEYDKNGNQLGYDVINSGQKRSIVWDEENRIQEIHDNGRTSRFKYNDAGERVIKRTEQGETAYVNQFWTVRNRSVGTKHIFVGETRIASKLVPGEDHVDPKGLWSQTMGGWWKQLSQGQKPFKNPHFAGSNMPQKLPEDNFVFFYHPDHVGSTSYVTDKDGELYEHVQYFPFGETWVHEHSNTEKLPYLYTSKELDEETGLYYFGARYYDPRTGVWQSADPLLAGALPIQLGFFAYEPANLALYAYSWQSPIVLFDPTGLEPTLPRVNVQELIRRVRTRARIGPKASGAATAMVVSLEIYWGQVQGLGQDLFLLENARLNTEARIRMINEKEEKTPSQPPTATETQAEAAPTPAPGGAGGGAKKPPDTTEAAPASPSPELTPEQAANLKRFQGKFRKGIETTVEAAGEGTVRFRAEVPGRVQGSKAVYEKLVDASGKTIRATKTTIDPKGKVVHVKDKLQ